MSALEKQTNTIMLSPLGFTESIGYFWSDLVPFGILIYFLSSLSDMSNLLSTLTMLTIARKLQP